MNGYLTAAQVDQLLAPIRQHRVAFKDGLSHLEAWDVRAHMNRVFGFARWSADLVDLAMIYETPTETRAGKPAFKVAYRATVALRVDAPDGTTLATYTEAAVGESIMPDFKRGDSHDMAIKTAESQAFKRCAINLGSQFGLSLYQNGNTDDVVRGTLVHPTEAAADVEGVPVDVPADGRPR